MRSTVDDDGRTRHLFLTSLTCPAIDDSMAEFGELAIPEWTFDQPPPEPVVEGQDIPPTPKDGTAYRVGMDLIHQRGSAWRIEVEFGRGEQEEAITHLVRRLDDCWSDEPVNLIHYSPPE